MPEWGSSASLNGLVRGGLIEKVTFEENLEGGKGMSHRHTWGAKACRMCSRESK